MAKTKNTTMGMGTSLKPKLIKHYGLDQVKTRSRRVRHFGIPGLGRIAFSRDLGEADLFGSHYLSTKLKAIVRDPYGKIVGAHDLGSGKITNVGVLALAYDSQQALEGKAKEPFTLFPNLKYHAWGTGTGENEKDIKLEAFSAAQNTTKAVAAITTTVTPAGLGEPKIVSTSKLEEKAAGPTAITEWGIFTTESISATTGEPLVSVTATEGKTTGAALTESTSEIKGERLQILVATEATEIWGLITKNTKTIVTVPAWYKQSTGGVQEPTGTSKYTIRPVMFDHRKFAVINVSEKNVIEFPWELTIKSGG